MVDFVTFEITKKLKEKGYPQVKQNTLAMYDESGEWYPMAETIDDEPCYIYEAFDDRDYVCPTISQVLKWLREERQYHICIGYDGVYSYEIVGIEDCEFVAAEDDYDTWEEAALAGIEYLLDNVI